MIRVKVPRFEIGKSAFQNLICTLNGDNFLCCPCEVQMPLFLKVIQTSKISLV